MTCLYENQIDGAEAWISKYETQWIQMDEMWTYLERAALPGEDGCFALIAKEVGDAHTELCSKYFCVAFDKLKCLRQLFAFRVGRILSGIP